MLKKKKWVHKSAWTGEINIYIYTYTLACNFTKIYIKGKKNKRKKNVIYI